LHGPGLWGKLDANGGCARHQVFIAIAAVVLVAGAANGADATGGAPAPLAADTPSATPSGVTFTAPKAWSIVTVSSLIVLSPPEPDSHIAIVDVPSAADARAATAAAWTLYRPDARHPLKRTIGWFDKYLKSAR
jgi:hypothetical protein